jgi:type I restriction enzyme M protein
VTGVQTCALPICANFPASTPNIWAKEYVYGCEINPDLGLATKVNMVLHGDGNINIFAGDPQGNGLNNFSTYSIVGKVSVLSHSNIINNFSYDKPVNAGFDVVVSNPPFSIDKKALPGEDQLALLFLYNDKGNSENLFIERWYQLLNPGGRLGVVLPESVFDTSENLYIRLFLYKYFTIKAVISLPYLAFQPFTSTKTSLLFAQKKGIKEVEVYEARWREYQNEYQRLQRAVKKFQINEIKDSLESKNTLIRYLKSYFDPSDATLSMSSIMIKYAEELAEIHSNPSWWVFGEVSTHFTYDILFAEAEEIGYKRSKRGEQKRRNDLFSEDDSGQIVINTKEPKTILDWIKLKVSWN